MDRINAPVAPDVSDHTTWPRRGFAHRPPVRAGFATPLPSRTPPRSDPDPRPVSHDPTLLLESEPRSFTLNAEEPGGILRRVGSRKDWLDKMKNDSRRAPRVQPDLRVHTRPARRAAVIALACFAASAANASAALVAQYTFEDANANDSSASTNTYNLANSSFGTTAPAYLVGSGTSNTYAHFTGSAAVPEGKALVTPTNALQANGDDGGSDWIVSLWFRTDDWNQGANRSFFSTAADSNANGGWQHNADNGAGETARNDGSNDNFAWSAQPTVDEWHHLYLIKNSDTSWQLYLDKTLVVTDTSNVGRVDEIRLGVNRNNPSRLRVDLDYIQVWTAADDPGSDLITAYDAGFAHINIPAPTTFALVSLTAFALAGRRRRAVV